MRAARRADDRVDPADCFIHVADTIFGSEIDLHVRPVTPSPDDCMCFLQFLCDGLSDRAAWPNE